MEPLTITIANELTALPVLQAATGAFVQAAGDKSSVARQMELVVEEIITNIIKYEYLPGRRERIELTIAIDGKLLELVIRFKGIPFDIEYLRQCEQISLEDMLISEGCGIGLHLIRQFSDDVRYRNLGKEGQEIRITRSLSSNETILSRPVAAEQESEQVAAPFNICIRRMLPTEAATISKLAYFAYTYSYIYEHIYDPEQVRLLNEDNRLMSYVAVHEDNGAIVGHMAMIPDKWSDMNEFGVAFVNPIYRRSGCLNALAEHMIGEARKRKCEGVFGTAVSTHPYSQKTAVQIGMREAALLVSRGSPLAMRAIREEAVARESLFFMVRLFGETSRGPYYAPRHHRKMIERICGNLRVTALFADDPGEIPSPECGQLEKETDHYQTGHIFIHSYGKDTLHEVRAIQCGWRLDRLETIYLYLPLLHPATERLCASFEETGFFFSGIRHSRGGNDWLVLQYLNNQRYDYGLLKAATPLGQELIDYVRGCDPISLSENSGITSDRI